MNFERKSKHVSIVSLCILPMKCPRLRNISRMASMGNLSWQMLLACDMLCDNVQISGYCLKIYSIGLFQQNCFATITEEIQDFLWLRLKMEDKV